MRILILLLISVTVITACGDVEVDYMFNAQYYIDNRTTQTLYVDASLRIMTEYPWGTGLIITNIIPPNTNLQFSVNENSFTPPSTNFTSFSIAYSNSGGLTVIYSNVNDNHWDVLTPVGANLYILTIPKLLIP